MTQKLEKLFDLPEISKDEIENALATANDVSREMNLTNPREDDVLDVEIDTIASKAMNSYEELMSLGMNVEARFAAPIFDSASKMLGHAVTAKLGKAHKKLKEAELKLKAIKMGEDDRSSNINTSELRATVLDRNELIKSLKQ
jgi:hypothetical protein